MLVHGVCRTASAALHRCVGLMVAAARTAAGHGQYFEVCCASSSVAIRWHCLRSNLLFVLLYDQHALSCIVKLICKLIMCLGVLQGQRLQQCTGRPKLLECADAVYATGPALHAVQGERLFCTNDVRTRLCYVIRQPPACTTACASRG